MIQVPASPLRRPDVDHDAVCESTHAHRVVIAPPGTGKTHLAVRLAGELTRSLPAVPVPQTITGPRVLLLTFSNQARVQLERELAQLDERTRRQVEVWNYHALFFAAVRAHRRALGIAEDIDVVGATERCSALNRVDPAAVAQLGREAGLLEAFAEQAIPAFRDERTPADPLLTRLLDVVRAEQHAGRLVFDDFGALFWQLLDRFPAIENAYRARYPVVIADEHQDASALQDAVVRRLASRSMIILADPLQLIHGYRGARDERLDAHQRDCDQVFELRTPHRWRDQPTAGDWLLALRARLLGLRRGSTMPSTVTIRSTDPIRGINAVLSETRFAVLDVFKSGATRVAVLARENDLVLKLRSYLVRNNLHPRDNPGSSDFEAARAEIEALRSVTSTGELASHLLTRLADLAPGLEATVVKQIRGRIRDDDVNLRGAGSAARPILEQIAGLYTVGPSGYFTVLSACLRHCRSAGHHVVHGPNVQIIHETATRLALPNPASDVAARVDPTVTTLSAYATAAARGAIIRTGRDQAGLYVMTAHQSKGKEFDAVVIADASKRYYPDNVESRRLFYVAITRARAHWELITPADNPSPLLRFLRE